VDKNLTNTRSPRRTGVIGTVGWGGRGGESKQIKTKKNVICKFCLDTAKVVSSLLSPFILMMVAISSSEMSVLKEPWGFISQRTAFFAQAACFIALNREIIWM
jgi:hypothetical protein